MNNFHGVHLLITNAMLITSQNVFILVECYDHFYISLDGCDKESSSMIREFKEMPGIINRAWRKRWYMIFIDYRWLHALTGE